MFGQVPLGELGPVIIGVGLAAFAVAQLSQFVVAASESCRTFAPLT